MVELFGFGWSDLFNLGMLGSGMFLFSWLYQAGVSKRTGKSIVTIWFWLFRLAGLSLMLIYGISIRNLVLILTNFVGLLLTSYNIYLFKKNDKKTQADI